MKRFKRVLSLLVCVLVALGMSTGCSSTDGKSGETTKESSAAGEKSSEVSASKLTDKEVTLTMMRGEHPSQPFLQDSPILSEIYKKTGIKIELEAVTSDYEQKAATLVASGDMPDIMIASRLGAVYYSGKNVFLPVSDYFDVMPNYMKVTKDDPNFTRCSSDGKYYYLVTSSRSAATLSATSPLIRQDLLESLNLEMPKTFDELHNVLKEFKKAQPDTFPWTCRWETKRLLYIAAYPMGSGYGQDNGMYFDKDIEGGKWVYGAVRPEFKEVLAYFSTLYKEGILDPDFAINTSQQFNEKMSSGKSTFMWENGGFALNYNKALAAADPKQKFVQMELLTNSKGQKRNFIYSQYNKDDAIVVNKNVKDPGLVMKFIDWFYSEEGTDVTNFGVLNEHYTIEGDKRIPNPDYIAKFKNDADSWRSYMSSLGAGQLGLAFRYDTGNQEPFLSAEDKNFYEFWKTADGFVEELMNPPFTLEEQNELKELNMAVDAILLPELDRFILGTTPLSEFEGIAQKAVEAGALKIEEIYNKAEGRLKN